tara:strand:- start:1199 stop:1528 length:330 start_codon:yes stop_codon:yes gene_type:complete
MHMPKKHMVEEVEKALKEAGLGKELEKISNELDAASKKHKGQADRIRGLIGKADKMGHQKPEMPGIKIVVNVGAGPSPMPMPKPMKKAVKKAKKARMAGKMEDALSGMY